LTRSHIKWFGEEQAEVRLGADNFELITMQRRRIFQSHYINPAFLLALRLGKLSRSMYARQVPKAKMAQAWLLLGYFIIRHSSVV
jgi:hypothetical protein